MSIDDDNNPAQDKVNIYLINNKKINRNWLETVAKFHKIH
jgi:hypothetical protein